MSVTEPISELGEVFISYSWDNDQHIEAVLSLSNRLRAEGVDCVLDQYEVSPPEGWPRWMERKISDAALVLVVCTETYLNRVLGRETEDKGHGVKWEGNIIYQHLYNQGSNNTKFIPVILKGSDREFIPIPLQGASFFLIDSDAGYQRLYERIMGKPRAQKPPLGQRKPMPKKDVRTDPRAYIVSPIDIPLWDEAKWRATVFIGWPDRPPALGIAFLNRNPAQRIFEQWQLRYGKRDEFEELRVAIIEGNIPGEDPGYSVHLGIDIGNVIDRYSKAGLTIEDGAYFASTSRINRMNPKADSQYLPMFKKSYAQFGEYLLVPSICRPDGSGIELAPHLAITKKVIHFRNVREIGPEDIDSVVLHTGSQGRPLTDFGRELRRARSKKNRS